MTTPPPRPWWKKKRWAAAISIWLVLGYIASAGPSSYCVARGWYTAKPHNALYTPANALARLFPPLSRALGVYGQWWVTLANRHDEPERLRREAERRESIRRAAQHRRSGGK